MHESVLSEHLEPLNFRRKMFSVESFASEISVEQVLNFKVNLIGKMNICKSIFIVFLLTLSLGNAKESEGRIIFAVS